MKFCFVNLWFAWLWMLLGFLSGMVMGMFFQREHWLGGYASFRRRLYRLGHVSFFGLGALNLFFYFTAQSVTGNAEVISIASMAMIAGGISMPLCCLVVAHFPKAKMLFAFPVVSLIAGGALTLLNLAKV
jgi:hypothetical protein